MSAKTKSKWIKLPPTWIENPNSHRTKSITTAVQTRFNIIASLKDWMKMIEIESWEKDNYQEKGKSFDIYKNDP